MLHLQLSFIHRLSQTENAVFNFPKDLLSDFQIICDVGMYDVFNKGLI